MDIKNLFDIAKIFIPLFVVIDPIGSMVLFVSMTSSYSELEKREATKDAFVYGLIIMILFTLGGSILLELMGISIAAIQIAGGIILLIMGIEMVREGDRPKSTGKTYKNPDLGIVPFATPLLAGPGAISLVIILSQSGLYAIIEVLASLITIFVIVVILFTFGTKISRAIGDKSLKAITRIFGLLVAAFAIQFIIDAIEIISLVV
ncbi:MAG: MarC family protein [Thermoplasmataceae archaeon]|jgi:multiple antibiotic resistance protein|nr:MAG: MarC family integral membrane protein [Thermoplasmatales archaeon E-plasma]